MRTTSRRRRPVLVLAVAIATAAASTWVGAAAAATVEGEAALHWLRGELDVAGGVLTSFGAPDVGLTQDAVLALALAGRAADPVVQGSFDAMVPLVADYITGFGDDTDRVAGATAKTFLTELVVGGGPDGLPLDLEADLRELMRVDAPQAGRFSDRGASGDHSNGYGQAFAILALSRTTGGVPASAIAFLLDQQCPGGGFRGSYTGTPGCVDDAQSDLDYTAIALGALATVPDAPGVAAAIARTVTHLEAAQRPDGGFANSGGDPNSNTTGLLAQALRVVGAAGPADAATSYVAGLQLTAGGAGAAAADVGAIAFVAAAKAEAIAGGITDQTRDQFRRATAQAVLAFGIAPYGAVPAPPTGSTTTVVGPISTSPTSSTALDASTSSTATSDATSSTVDGATTSTTARGGALPSTGSDVVDVVLWAGALVFLGLAARQAAHLRRTSARR